MTTTSSLPTARRFTGRTSRIVITLCVAAGGLAAAVPADGATAGPLAQVWKKTFNGKIIESSPGVVHLDGDGVLDVVVGADDSSVFGLRGPDGNNAAGWPQGAGYAVNSSPSVADTDGNGTPEIFVGSGSTAPNAPGALLSFNSNGSQRWRFNGADGVRSSLPFHSTPALGDINNDGSADVTAGALGVTAWSLSQSGSVNPGWPYMADDTIFSSPALVDVNGDGQTDVVLGGDSSAGSTLDWDGGVVRALTGQGQVIWQFRTDEIVRSSPSVGDIDGDGVPEIVFGTGDHWSRLRSGIRDVRKVFALDLAGRLKPGWPQATNGWTMGSPALSDLNGDGRLDVAMATWDSDGGSVYGWTGNGGLLWSRRSVGGVVIGSVVTADFNGDGGQDVLVASGGGLHAYNGKSGALLWSALDGAASFQNSPLVKDLDSDGLLDIVVAGQAGGQGVAYRFEMTTTAAKVGSLAWPMFRRDERRTGSWTSGPLSQNFCIGTKGGYWLTAADGGIFAFCDAPFHGSTGAMRLAQPIVGMTPTPGGAGYWMVARDGGIFAFGDAGFYGSTGGMPLAQPIVGMAAKPKGKGYWLVASDGGIFAFGDAGFHGSTGGTALNRPIVGMAPTPSGNGYWLVASDGGIFAFGDAKFHGSTGAIRLVQPIVGMASTATGNGYWLVASDGGIFAFGDARFHGSTGDIRLAKPIVGMTGTKTGNGYWMVASDGGIFAFGDAVFKGSTGGMRLVQPIVGMANASP
jgi:hypothetical protein